MRLIISLCFVATLFSCTRVTPAGFWRNFEKGRLVEIISDQGPWGGHHALYWNAEKEHYFDTKKVIDFAQKNGWELLNSKRFRSDELRSWYDGKSPVFPLSEEGFNPKPVNSSVYKYFPRWINEDLTVFSFKTNWITVKPGSDSSTATNGFLIISTDGRKMSVYHIWGE